MCLCIYKWITCEIFFPMNLEFSLEQYSSNSSHKFKQRSTTLLMFLEVGRRRDKEIFIFFSLFSLFFVFIFFLSFFFFFYLFKTIYNYESFQDT